MLRRPRRPGWRDRLKALAPGGTVDVVLDPLGGATEPAFRSLGWGGRHLMGGFAGGGIPALRGNLALLKGASLVGVDARQFREREPEAAAASQAPHSGNAEILAHYGTPEQKQRHLLLQSPT